MKRSAVFWWGLAALGLLLFFFIAYWANTSSMPGWLKAIYDFPNGDRLGHFVIYGLLAYVFSAALGNRRLRLGRFSVAWGVLAAVALATGEEISQLFVASRTADWLDLLAGYAGIFASTFVPCVKS